LFLKEHTYRVAKKETKMRAYSIAFIFISFNFLVFSSFASEPLNSSQTLNIYTINYPPYSILQNNSGLKGQDIEVIEKAFENRGIQVNFTFVSIRRSMEELKHGRVFAMTICGKTEERLEYAYFTDPISFFTLGFIYRKGTMNLKKMSWAEIKKRNLTISTVRGFVAENELIANNINSYLVISLDKGIKMTGVGHIKIFYAGIEASSDLARRYNHHKDFEYVKAPGHSYFDNYLCISKKWPRASELLIEFNLGLKAIKESGAYEKILQKYKRG